jgi:hypothetical protein
MHDKEERGQVSPNPPHKNIAVAKKQFIAYSKQHPSVYQWEGSYGQTLLHCVCTNRPSPDNIIQMLLDKNPQSIVKQD